MKKILCFLAIVILVIVIFTQDKKSTYIIPNNAIRLRIVANSNSNYDQFIKSILKVKLEEKISTSVDSSSVVAARKSIIDNIPYYSETINNVFKEQSYNQSYDIKFGMNYFPQKTYKGVKYLAGNYESLLITIGEGKGDNWWCVLFPPLCSLEVEQKEDVEYRFYVKDLFEKYLDK